MVIKKWTTIPLRKTTVKRLKDMINKGVTYDEAINTLIDKKKKLKT